MIIALIFACYAIIMSIAVLRWYPRNYDKEQTFSIVVAFRNEAKVILNLLHSLEKLDYPEDKFEVYLVDDASTDESPAIVADFFKNKSNMHLLRLTEKSKEYLGKKAALKLGVETAKNEIILFTDGDTIVPIQWLRSMNSYFTPETGMVIGYVRGKYLSWLKRFKRIISLGIFAATAGMGTAFSCSGGNLAVRKKAFDEVEGYDTVKSYISGDDKLLLNLIRKTKWKIAFNSDVKVIEVNRGDSLTEYINREKRQMGKFNMTSPLYKVVFLTMFAFFIWLPVYLIQTKSLMPIVPFFTGAVFFYIASCIRLKEKINPFDLLLFVILPYHMFLFSIWGSLSSYSWKN
ncbi:MAG: glycosyltransferase [Candidatus Cloacimonetes bacterium]|nr:glycosyltransferase [Candidatus Cloacimonadota bacterium]